MLLKGVSLLRFPSIFDSVHADMGSLTLGLFILQILSIKRSLNLGIRILFP